MIDLNEKAHGVFKVENAQRLADTYLYFRTKYPNETILIMTDHRANDDFFYDMNSALIELTQKYLMGPMAEKPIIPLPLGSNENEFITMLSKMRGGTMLIDSTTFKELNFKSKNPLYFYANRIVIHRNGKISACGGRKF